MPNKAVVPEKAFSKEIKMVASRTPASATKSTNQLDSTCSEISNGSTSSPVGVCSLKPPIPFQYRALAYAFNSRSLSKSVAFQPKVAVAQLDGKDSFHAMAKFEAASVEADLNTGLMLAHSPFFV